MSLTIRTQPLTRADFAPFGDVLDAGGEADKIINQGKCGRFHDRARLDFFRGHAGISIFNAEARSLPYTLDMMERHPQGSQAFIPMHSNPYLVVVATDNQGTPGRIHAFVAGPGQGVNYHRNTWHGVLTPLMPPGLFAVVDRIGAGNNLQEFWFETPHIVVSDHYQAGKEPANTNS